MVVAGMVGGVPFHGGATWAVLQYLLGLRRLGHRVRFVESVSPSGLLPPGTALARSANVRYASAVMRRAGLDAGWAVLLSGTRESAGLSYEEAVRAAEEADVLVNLGGTLTDAGVLGRARLRVYVDLDPGFTQVWHAGGLDVGLDAHDRFVTVGQHVGRAGCAVPACGKRWIPSLPPVVLEEWTPAPVGAPRRGWTTVANWRSYGSVSHGGVVYGQKAHSWRALVGLPGLTGQRFEVAVAIGPGDVRDAAALRENGWTVLDPAAHAGTPASYRSYVRSSTAEIAVAKSGYVGSSSGWFSDRSACYLAAGRPVVAQETGFSRTVPTGEGLLAFTDVGEAADAVRRVVADYDKHRLAARRVAEECFDSDRVLPVMLEQVGAAS